MSPLRTAISAPPILTCFNFEEIGEPDIFEEFAEALGLKPLQRRRLLKGIQGRTGASESAAVGKPFFPDCDSCRD